MFINIFTLLCVFLICSSAVLAQTIYPPLPEPVSNNAVALVSAGSNKAMISFMGLGRGKEYSDVHNKVWSLHIGDEAWQQKSSVPSSLPISGRLASVAVGVDNMAFLFGGYTVAKDHAEISSPDNFAYNLATDTYQKIAPTPVPVDDSIALVYQQRYIYLISGWHNDGNVNLVQVYDIQTDGWQQASPFLGSPVFGHAGGIVENYLLVCDGVKVQAQEQHRRKFMAETACYSGTIDQQNAYKIDWRKVPHPTGKGRYRMAASGVVADNTIVFAGGSTNPYNYNGIGYDGSPSEPDPQLWTYDVNKGDWQIRKTDKATMDHRGLLVMGKQLIIVGGMGKQQQLKKQVTVMTK